MCVCRFKNDLFPCISDTMLDDISQHLSHAQVSSVANLWFVSWPHQVLVVTGVCSMLHQTRLYKCTYRSYRDTTWHRCLVLITQPSTQAPFSLTVSSQSLCVHIKYIQCRDKCCRHKADRVKMPVTIW